MTITMESSTPMTCVQKDFDSDNDGVNDPVDSCPTGITGWISSSSTDYDSDGCKDTSAEDLDDDNDGINDSVDSCATGTIGWNPTPVTDYDSDGCQDSGEDTDDEDVKKLKELNILVDRKLSEGLSEKQIYNYLKEKYENVQCQLVIKKLAIRKLAKR